MWQLRSCPLGRYFESGINFLHNIYLIISGIYQTQDWIFCPKSSFTERTIKSTRVCRLSVQVKRKGGVNRPRDARSNSSTVRQEINRGCECSDTWETHCYFPCTVAILHWPQFCKSAEASKTDIELHQTWDYFTSKYPFPSTEWEFFNNLCPEIPNLLIQMA